jgi:hypothetical protein
MINYININILKKLLYDIEIINRKYSVDGSF